jgi:predicted nucleic acid-binding protein
VTVWVTDASPLIFLAKLDRLSLLRDGADTVCIPQAVLDEICAKPDAATQAIELACQSWLIIRDVSNREAVAILQADLGLGEAEAIALAREVGAERIVLDDLDARRRARRLELKPVGTAGLLLAAHRRGEIPSLGEEFGRLQDFGFRISSPLREALLREAGE